MGSVNGARSQAKHVIYGGIKMNTINILSGYFKLILSFASVVFLIRFLHIFIQGLLESEHWEDQKAKLQKCFIALIVLVCSTGIVQYFQSYFF